MIRILAYCFAAGSFGFWLGVKYAVKEMNKHLGGFTHLFTIDEPVDTVNENVKEIAKEKN